MTSLVRTVALLVLVAVFGWSTSAGADTYQTLRDNVINGTIVEGLGYTYSRNSNAPSYYYTMRGSNEAYNGINFINISFHKKFSHQPDMTISFNTCSNSTDTESMFRYLRDRPLLTQHVDAADAEIMGTKVRVLNAFDIDELSKTVTRYDDTFVKYVSTTQMTDNEPWETTSYDMFVGAGWCLAGTTKGSLDEMFGYMATMRDNTRRLLGIAGPTDSADTVPPPQGDDGGTTDQDGFNSGDGASGDNQTDVDLTDNPDLPDEPIISGADEPLSPEAIAAGAIAAGGIAGLGAWLAMGQMGVRPRDALDGLGDLLRGRLPNDGFDDWKARHEAMGWKYREENGVAIFEPPEGWSERTSAPPPLPAHHDGDINPDTDEVWSSTHGGWVGRSLAGIEAREAAERAAAKARNREAVAAWDAETQQLDAGIAADARARAALEAAESAGRDRIADKLTRLLERDGQSADDIERLRASGDLGALEDRYAEVLREAMARTSADAEYWERWARIHGAGAIASKVVLAGAKGTMMMVTGPTGYIPAAIGTGILRSAEEGAQAYVASDGDKRALGTALVSGFFSGVKDGVVGRYASLPRTGANVKVFLPAAADAGETYVRTGDINAAASTFAVSSMAGKVGSKLDTMNQAVTRETAHLATGTAAGAAGSWLNGGSATEGAADGFLNALGGRAGQHIGTHTVPMTRQEIAMDLEYKAKLADARQRIDALKTAVASGDEGAVKNALNDVLNHREAKIMIEGKTADPGFQKTYSELAQEHRTKPVFDGMADSLNRQTVKGPDGTDQPRFVMRDAANNERPVTGSDFASGSGRPERTGVDLDVYPNGTIIDKRTGLPARHADVEAAAHDACNKLGIDPHKQEVTVTGVNSPEDMLLKKGETVPEMINRVQTEGKASSAEGQRLTEVATHKLNEANRLHGDGAGSSAVAENARGIMKHHGRFVEGLIKGDGAARVPETFRRQIPGTDDTPLTILKKVADGDIPPGTGNAMFRRVTGMDISDATPKIASWAEPLGKWGGTMPTGAKPLTPSFTGPGAGADLQQGVASVIRDTLEKKDGG